MRRSNKLAKGAVIALSVSMILAGCSSQENTDTTENSSVVVDVISAQKGSLTLSNQFIGTVAPQESVYVIPLAQGQVTATYA